LVAVLFGWNSRFDNSFLTSCLELVESKRTREADSMELKTLVKILKDLEYRQSYGRHESVENTLKYLIEVLRQHFEDELKKQKFGTLKGGESR